MEEYGSYPDDTLCECSAEAENTGYKVTSELVFLELDEKTTTKDDQLCTDYIAFNNDGRYMCACVCDLYFILCRNTSKLIK